MIKAKPISNKLSSGNPINELRTLLREPVLLLHVPEGKKAPAGKWSKCTLVDMQRPEYLATLRAGNIGVVLGERSHHLVSVDIDSDDDAREFLQANLWLDTLITKGARGLNAWLRMDGRYPTQLQKLTKKGKPWGEWRANGAQTIIHGTHPSGVAYRILEPKKTAIIPFDSLVWPAGVTPPKILPVQETLHREDGEHREDRVTEEVEEVEEVERLNEIERLKEVTRTLLCELPSLDKVLAVSVPRQRNTSHNKMFPLCRWIKAKEEKDGNMGIREKREFFKKWHELASPYLDPMKTGEQYFMEFLTSCAAVRTPLTSDSANQAFLRATTEPQPQEAELFEDPKLRLLVCHCWQLQLGANPGPFYLSARKCADLHKISFSSAASWLSGLVAFGILTIVEKSTPTKAARYRYVQGSPK